MSPFDEAVVKDIWDSLGVKGAQGPQCYISGKFKNNKTMTNPQPIWTVGSDLNQIIKELEDEYYRYKLYTTMEIPPEMLETTPKHLPPISKPKPKQQQRFPSTMMSPISNGMVGWEWNKE